MRRRFARALGAAALALVPVFAGADGISSQQADEILKELRAIHSLLERGAAPQAAPAAAPGDAPVKLKLTGAYVLGRLDAPVTVVEFTDYECPFCRQFHVSTFDALKSKYIDSGKVRYVTRDFPLDMHPNARAAAKMARCAGEEGRFWDMRHALIVNGPSLGTAMATLPRSLKLDEATMQHCVADAALEKALQADIDQAAALGVSGTPTFVVGRSDGDSVDGTRIVGALPLATFEARIDALLAPPN